MHNIKVREKAQKSVHLSIFTNDTKGGKGM